MEIELNSCDVIRTRYLSTLESSFNSAIRELVEDPLMQCFQENSESQEFMFERIKEIVSDSMNKAKDTQVEECVQKISALAIKNKGLSNDLKLARNKIKSLENPTSKNVY
jgi:hypothetical protein